LPLLVYAGISGRYSQAIPLAAATAFFGQGLNLLDDLADGDASVGSGATDAASLNLTAAELLVSLPQLTVSDIPAPPVTIALLLKIVAAGFLKASAGQRQDFLMTGNAKVTATQAEECAAGKGGACLEMAALLGAHLAGASDTLVSSYAAYGRALGTAQSLKEDCWELYIQGRESDLVAGKRSFPIAVHLGRQKGRARLAFLQLLSQAQREPNAREEVRLQIRSGGTLRYCLLIIETYRQEALQALITAAPSEPAAGVLHWMVDHVTLL